MGFLCKDSGIQRTLAPFLRRKDRTARDLCLRVSAPPVAECERMRFVGQLFVLRVTMTTGIGGGEVM